VSIEDRSIVRDSEPYLRSTNEWRRRFDETSEQTHILRVRGDAVI